MKISGIIHTLNEEPNIANAINSLKSWVDEVIVVDMHSTDQTVKIAQELGANIFFHERIAAVEGARQFAVNQASGEWVVLLDADELIPKKLAENLQAIADQNHYDAVLIRRENYMFGAIINHTGWSKDQERHFRFFKKNNAVSFSDIIHDPVKNSGSAKVFEMPFEPGLAIVHFNYISIRHFFEKMNRYTSVEAEQRIKIGEHRSGLFIAKVMAWTFWNRYIKLRGYKDGWRGIVLSVSMVVYEFLIYAKMLEISKVGTEADIRRQYQSIAETTLQEFETNK